MRPPEPIPLSSIITKKRLIILGIIAILIILLFSLKSIANFYTDYLWFESVNYRSVFMTTLETKIELGFIFIFISFVFFWINFYFVHRVSSSEPTKIDADDLTSYIRHGLKLYPNTVRTIVSLLVAIFMGSTAVSQWQNYLLFTHAKTFPNSDPQFNLNVGTFVFRLPFLSWLAGWVFGVLLVSLFLVALLHYASSNISIKGSTFSSSPAVKVHISVILALIAITKALSYYFVSRPLVDLSNIGVVQGASYTGVHIQLPAITLLTIISIASAIILIINIFRQGWKLPITAVLLWGVVSLVAGVIYPNVMQTFKVEPAQSSLELPYIKRNIASTRDAYQLSNIKTVPFAAAQDVTPSQLSADAQSLNDTKLWDYEYTLSTYDKSQDIKNYYQFTSMSYDRYNVNGLKTPVLVGIRELYPSGLPANSWVNLHLQYTHGYGAVISPVNQAASDGSPLFSVSDIPIVSQPGYPKITQPQVYFGIGQSGYVIVDSKQPELDYVTSNGNPIETHYSGNGGVPVDSLLNRIAYAIKFSDKNILFSSLISPQSKIIYNQDIQTRISQIAPFLTLDSDPYPVISKGSIYWIENAYTTTDYYPYSQTFNSSVASALNPNSGLNQIPFNYVRNSVKVVMNAYSGKTSFYVSDPSDPIIQAWESVYPNLFQPMSKMNSGLKSHLRYPEDMFAVQSAMYGKYHITNPTNFYNASNAWIVSQAPTGLNSGNQQPTSVPLNPNGRYSPNYQLTQMPDQTQPQFNLVEPFVPYSTSSGANDRQQILAGFLSVTSGQNDYGQMTAYVTPPGQSINGPAYVSSQIDSVPAVSQEITLLNQHGSTATLGVVQMIPVDDSLLYIRPMFVASAGNPIPTLRYVIVVYNNNVAMKSSLGSALQDVFNQPISGINPTSSSPNSSLNKSSSITTQIQQLLTQANQDFNQAQSYLSSGNLGQYQSEINSAEALVSQALTLTSQSSTPSVTTTPNAIGHSTTKSSTTTTTIKPNSA
jgi:hypothetical protein